MKFKAFISKYRNEIRVGLIVFIALLVFDLFKRILK